MKRHSDTATISLDPREEEILDLTLQIMVEEDRGVPEAAGLALAALPNPDPEFVRWLSNGQHELP